MFLLKKISDFWRLIACPESLSYVDKKDFMAWLSMVFKKKTLSSANRRLDTLGAPLHILQSLVMFLDMECLMRADKPSVQRMNKYGRGSPYLIPRLGVIGAYQFAIHRNVILD